MRYGTIIAILILANTFSSCKQQSEKLQQAERVLPFYSTPDFTPQWINDPDSLRQVHRIASFAFTGQDGNAVTEKTFTGKIYVADFFFTACPGICKKLTTHLSLVQDAYKSDPDILLLSHSVTPDADSVPVLRNYANKFGAITGKWFLVTGNRDSVYQIARSSYFADEDMGYQKKTSDFLHTENMLLIDRHSRIRGVYKGTSPADINQLITDIAILKKEE